MKKVFSLVLAVAAAMAVSSCGPKANPEIDAKLDKLEQVCDKAAECGEKVKGGDLEAVEQLAKYANEMSEITNDLASHSSEMTVDQAKRMSEATLKVNASLK